MDVSRVLQMAVQDAWSSYPGSDQVFARYRYAWHYFLGWSGHWGRVSSLWPPPDPDPYHDGGGIF